MPTKSIFASTGVWGSIVALIASILSTALKLDPQQGQELAGDLNNLLQGVLQVISVIGALVAFYGRIKATHQLRWPFHSNKQES